MSMPKLRFKDKKGWDFPDWEDKVFGDIALFFKGKGISKADISPDGNTLCIRYGELYTEYRETIKEVKSRTNVNHNGLQLSKFNDVIIPASGESEIDIAKASCVLLSNVALGGDLNIIRSKENGVFLSYYLNGKKKLDIAKLAQGISVIHLYSSQLKLLDLKIPSFQEQTKIADFLMAVDEKIAQLTQKCDLL
jgi:type I restriction enzyme S subunit